MLGPYFSDVGPTSFCSMFIMLFFAPTGSESVSQQSSYSHRSQPKPRQNQSETEGSSGYGSHFTVDSESEDASSPLLPQLGVAVESVLCILCAVKVAQSPVVVHRYLFGMALSAHIQLTVGSIAMKVN